MKTFSRVTAQAVILGLAVLATFVQVDSVEAADPYTTEELTIPGVVGPSPANPLDPRFCSGPGGTCLLSATLFLPTSGGPTWPAVMSQHGFPGNRGAAYVIEAAKLLASNGYAVLTWDARGFGTSQGYVMLDSPDYEVADISKLIDYLLTRPEIALEAAGDPLVGLYGQSYGGGIQPVAAALDPRIDVLVLREAWHDLVEALAPGGLLKYQWVSLLFGAGQAETQLHLAPDLTAWFAEINATGQAPDNVQDELRKRSAINYAGQVDIPTFVMQGEHDTLFNITQGVRNIKLVAASGAPTKLFWYWGGHGGYSNYPDGSNRTWEAADVMESRQLAWLNRYLKGDAGVDTGPVFEYYDGAGVLHSANQFPPFAEVSVALGDGGLAFLKESGRHCPQFGAPNCSFTELSNFSSPGNPGDIDPFDPLQGFLSLDTQPLSGPFPLVGVPRISFQISTTSGQPVSLFWKIFDVSPDGSAELINRLVTPIRAAPGETISLDLAGFAHTFPSGNMLRLTVSTTDAAYYGTDIHDQVTLAGPVELTLPVTSSAIAAPLPGAVSGGLLAATGAEDLSPAGWTMIAASIALAFTLIRRSRRAPRTA